MLKNIIPSFPAVEASLTDMAPMGYTLALNIRHLTPEFYRSTYPDAWVRQYTHGRYVIFDPVSIWSTMNIGVIRWSEISIPLISAVGNRVLAAARGHGLAFGAVAVQRNARSGEKCLLSISREDRELSDNELSNLNEILQVLISGVGEHAGLSPAELETLRYLSAGKTQAEIAGILNISADAVKKRLEKSRKTLGATNTVHAIAIATKRGLLHGSFLS